MKFLLISPAIEADRYPKGGAAFRVANYNLPLIASLTPPAINVRLIDEFVDTVPFGEQFDLVGISVITPTALRAYEIAQKFRKNGSRIVMGGIHPSVLPHECLDYADAVVIGEVEDVWARLMDDFSKCTLKKIYRSKEQSDLKNIPIPRWDLLNKKRYIVKRSLSTTRGCSCQCDFCSISCAHGPGFRMRPIADVIRDIKESGVRRLMFFDDNIIDNPKYARKLFEALIPLKVRWVSQATFQFTEDEELIKLAYKSGCRGILIGVDSLSISSLAGVNKRVNKVDQYSEGIKRLHNNGIFMNASFIFGFDHDDVSIFEKTLEFARQTGLIGCIFNILTPYPGTALYNNLNKEDRIIDKDWSHYHGKNHVVFKPAKMTEDELLNGMRWVRYECHSWGSILRRFLNSGLSPITSFGIGLPLNMSNRYYTRKEDHHPGNNPAQQFDN